MISYPPLFSLVLVSHTWSAPVSHLDQGMGIFHDKGISPPASAISIVSENFRHHVASGLKDQLILWLPYVGVQPQCGPFPEDGDKSNISVSRHYRSVVLPIT